MENYYFYRTVLYIAFLVLMQGMIFLRKFSFQAELHSHQLFMAGQHDMISIGGGGGNGIYLDGTLSRGKTESCKTFGNPPLCTSKDFDIAAIEVFGLAFAD